MNRILVICSRVALAMAVAPSVTSAQCVFEETLKISASDGSAGDMFGAPIDADGDVIVVGAPLEDGAAVNSGAAYVYRSQGDAWVEEQKLTSSDPQAFDDYGISVAVEGDVIVVGAFFDDIVLPDQGSAFVYRYDGTTWQQEQRLTPSDSDAGDRFGRSVAIQGNWLAVGAYRTDDPGVDSGSVYMFRHNGTQWVETEKIFASDAAAGDLFGVDLSLSGDALLVGAYFDDTTFLNTGSGYVYRYDGTAWQEEQKLIASDAAFDDVLGAVVSLDGDTAVLGAYGDDASGPDSGAVYVFEFNGSTWVEQQELVASDITQGDEFGWSVDLHGDVLAVGAYWDDDLGHDSGSAYIYRRMGTGWIEERKLLASDGASQAWFGSAVALHDEEVWVGASMHDAVGVDSGSLYRYDTREFVLVAEPLAVTSGQTLAVTLAPGATGNLTALFVVDVGGNPVFNHLVTLSFNAGCSANLAAVVPAGLTGLTASLQAYRLGPVGNLVASNVETVSFQ